MSPPRARAVPATGKREDEVLEVALDLFYERGFRAVGLRDITNALSMNIATLYHYFPSKDHILLRLQTDGMERLLRGAYQVLADTEAHTPGERLYELVRMHLRYHTEHRKVAKLHFTAYRDMAPESRATIRVLMRQYENVIMSAIAAAVESNEVEVPDIRMAAYTLIGAGAYVSNWYRPEGAETADFVVQTHADVLMRGLLRRP